MTMQIVKCKCGKVFGHYGDAVSCPHCFAALTQPRKVEAKKPEKKPEPEPLYRQAKRKARRTEAQRRAAQNMSDALQRAKSDMIRHVIDKVNAGYYTVFAFLADPSAYFDGAVMGKWVNNPFLRRSVVTAVRNHYAVEAPF
ncbi:MAG TPA: hypothetical protein PLE60_12870 [Candidatus Latescibacteria bacterium]|nr:hypothetical protein [Candidatus Latescibacterota bacterium]